MSELREILERCMGRNGHKPTNEDIARAALLAEKENKDLVCQHNEMAHEYAIVLQINERSIKEIAQLKADLEQANKDKQELRDLLVLIKDDLDSGGFDIYGGVFDKIDKMIKG